MKPEYIPANAVNEIAISIDRDGLQIEQDSDLIIVDRNDLYRFKEIVNKLIGDPDHG